MLEKKKTEIKDVSNALKTSQVVVVSLSTFGLTWVERAELLTTRHQTYH